MTKPKEDKGGVDGSGLYWLGSEMSDAEMARFGLRCRLPGDGIMALPYADKRSVQVGEWLVHTGSPRHAFRKIADYAGAPVVGIRAARLVRTKKTYTIVPDNAI